MPLVLPSRGWRGRRFADCLLDPAAGHLGIDPHAAQVLLDVLTQRAQALRVPLQRLIQSGHLPRQRPAHRLGLSQPSRLCDFPLTLRLSQPFVTAQVLSLEGGIDRSRLSTSQRVNGTAR